MILKIMNRKEAGSGYTLKDNVSRVTRNFDSEKKCVVLSVDYRGGVQGELIPVDDKVYVYNDDGKVINTFHCCTKKICKEQE